MSTVDTEIERLAARRHELWATCDPDGEIAGIAKSLTVLYEERRIERAKAIVGKGRSQIIHAAKLDTEIERLMGSG